MMNYEELQAKWLRENNLKIGSEVIINRDSTIAEIAETGDVTFYVMDNCIGEKVKIHCIDAHGIGFQFFKGCHIMKLHFAALSPVPVCTLEFQQRTVIVCHVRENGSRSGRGIAILNPGENSNLEEGKKIALRRAFDNTGLSKEDYSRLRKQRDSVEVDGLVEAEPMEKMYYKWAIETDEGHLYEATIASTRVDSIKKFEKIWDGGWRKWYDKGYRCVPVETFIRKVG